MISAGNPQNNPSSGRYAKEDYAHPISAPIYWIIDGVSNVMMHILPVESEAEFQEKLREASKKVREREDRAAIATIATGPIDSVLDWVEEAVGINEIETSLKDRSA